MERRGDMFCDCAGVGSAEAPWVQRAKSQPEEASMPVRAKICAFVLGTAPRHRPAAGGWLPRGDLLPAKGPVSIPEAGERGPPP